MISQKLKNILLITLVVIAMHGLEEVLSGFPIQDQWMVFFGNLVNTKTEVFYWTFHVMWWLLVSTGVILVMGNKKLVLAVLSLFGLMYFTELHHPIKALMSGHYYPGMFTGTVFPILGIFYWKELLINWRKNYGRS